MRTGSPDGEEWSGRTPGGHAVTSGDGTRIAFERLGEGPPVILVGGATCDRTMTRPLAEELAKRN